MWRLQQSSRPKNYQSYDLLNHNPRASEAVNSDGAKERPVSQI